MAVMLGATVYIVSFTLNLLLQLALTQNQNAKIIAGITGITTTIILLVICTNVYLKSVKISAKEGFLFGAITTIIGTILDTAISLSINSTDKLGNLDNPLFWAANLIVLTIPTIIGWRKSTK